MPNQTNHVTSDKIATTGNSFANLKFYTSDKTPAVFLLLCVFGTLFDYTTNVVRSNAAKQIFCTQFCDIPSTHRCQQPK